MIVLLDIDQCTYTIDLPKGVSTTLRQKDDFIEIAIGDWSLYVTKRSDVWYLDEEFPGNDEGNTITSGDLTHIFRTINDQIKLSHYCT